MDKPKMLFVDDRTNRIMYALSLTDYDVTVAFNVPESLRFLSSQDFSIVSLDHDLTGHDFDDPDTPTCGMEIVRYIEKCGWPPQRKRPHFIVHSSNFFTSNLMVERLKSAGFSAEHKPFGWKQYQDGCVAGAFDVIHPGYVYLLEEAKNLCHRVTVLLHDKPGQVFSVEDRRAVILSLKSVDSVLVYKTEAKLTEILSSGKFEVRVVGNDHRDSTTRAIPGIETIYHERRHDWSATRYKAMIREYPNG